MSIHKADVGERQSELVVVMGELHAAICSLRQATDLLVERIRPLSRTDSAQDSGRNVPVPESCTPVTQALRLEISDLHFITDVLNSAYARVEI